MVPKRIRELVWLEYIGRNFEGKCFSCNEKIDVFSWHAGHIIPNCDEGKATVENLRPICVSCNLSMGKKKMDIFINENDLKGKKNFEKRKYTLMNGKLVSN